VIRAALVDTAVFAYALGGEHPFREPCRSFLQRALRGEFALHASVGMVQELTFHRMRRTDRVTAVRQGRFAGRSCTLHPFDERVLDRALELIAESGIGGRDAVHAATAQMAGLNVIVSTDPAFDEVMRRLDPAAA
jgi:hypothetical protein